MFPVLAQNAAAVSSPDSSECVWKSVSWKTAVFHCIVNLLQIRHNLKQLQGKVCFVTVIS